MGGAVSNSARVEITNLPSKPAVQMKLESKNCAGCVSCTLQRQKSSKTHIKAGNLPQVEHSNLERENGNSGKTSIWQFRPSHGDSVRHPDEKAATVRGTQAGGRKWDWCTFQWATTLTILCFLALLQGIHLFLDIKERRQRGEFLRHQVHTVQDPQHSAGLALPHTITSPSSWRSMGTPSGQQEVYTTAAQSSASIPAVFLEEPQQRQHALFQVLPGRAGTAGAQAQLYSASENDLRPCRAKKKSSRRSCSQEAAAGADGGLGSGRLGGEPNSI